MNNSRTNKSGALIRLVIYGIAGCTSFLLLLVAVDWGKKDHIIQTKVDVEKAYKEAWKKAEMEYESKQPHKKYAERMKNNEGCK